MSLSGESGGGEQMIWMGELRLSHFCVLFFGFLCYLHKEMEIGR